MKNKIILDDKKIFSVMTYNIRCLTPDDKGERSWSNRKKLVEKVLQEYTPAIIGFQETKVLQYNDLKNFLHGYQGIITYRDNSLFKEANPIFFRTDMFELLESKTFWLSLTPEKMSKDWNSNCYRICTMAKLKDKTTGKEFLIMNTHLDHISEEARINGIKLIVEESKKHNLPTLLLGDFNAEPDEETIKIADTYLIDTGIDFSDRFSGTFNNYEHTTENYVKIDYIYQVGNKFEVLDYKVIYNTYNNVFPSDHFPIIINIKYKHVD